MIGYKEVSLLLGKAVSVKTINGLIIRGKLTGYLVKNIDLGEVEENIVGVSINIHESIRFEEIVEIIAV